MVNTVLVHHTVHHLLTFLLVHSGSIKLSRCAVFRKAVIFINKRITYLKKCLPVRLDCTVDLRTTPHWFVFPTCPVLLRSKNHLVSKYPIKIEHFQRNTRQRIWEANTTNIKRKKIKKCLSLKNRNFHKLGFIQWDTLIYQKIFPLRQSLVENK